MTTIPLTLEQLKDLLTDAASVAVSQYLRHADPKSDILSKREAEALYGAGRLRDWYERGIITRSRHSAAPNSKLHYSRAECDAAAKAERLGIIIGQSLM